MNRQRGTQRDTKVYVDSTRPEPPGTNRPIVLASDEVSDYHGPEGRVLVKDGVPIGSEGVLALRHAMEHMPIERRKDVAFHPPVKVG